MSRPRERRLGPLVRDMVTFQFKLLLDALRDIVLSPLALGAAALDLLLIRRQDPRFFRTLLRYAHRSEHWIDLWATLAKERYGVEPQSIDGLIAHVESVVRDPRVGPHKARVLRRWLEMQLHRHARESAAVARTVGDAGAAASGDGMIAGAGEGSGDTRVEPQRDGGGLGRDAATRSREPTDGLRDGL